MGGVAMIAHNLPTAQVVDFRQRLLTGHGEDDIVIVLLLGLDGLGLQHVGQIAQHVVVAQDGMSQERGSRDVQLDLLDLTHGLRAEHAIELAVVKGDLGQRADIALVDKLADVRGIVHRLVLQRRQTVVEHAVGHMQLGILEFGTSQLVVGQLKIVELHALAAMAVVEPVAIVEHVVGRHDEQQDDHKQDDGDALVGLRLLHDAAIVGQRVVGREFLEQLGIHLIIIRVKLPFVECKGRHGTLVADVENDLIVDVDAVVQPLYLGRQGRGVAISLHQQLALGMAPQVGLIKAFAAGVGKLERALVLPVDVAEIGRIGKDVSLALIVDSHGRQTS